MKPGTTWIALVALAFPLGSGLALAQEPRPAASPQRVDSVSLSDRGTRTLVLIAGRFDPQRISEVMLTPVNDGQVFSLDIPFAVPGPALEPSRRFPGHPRLRRLDAKATGGAPGTSPGRVSLVMELAPDTRASLDMEGSGPSALLVALESSAAAAGEITPPLVAQEPGAGPPAPEAAPASPSVAALEEPRTFAAPWQNRPTLVRIAVLNALTGRANQVAALLMDVRRLALEQQMGMRLEVMNVSNAPGRELAQSVIYYRPGFLRAALVLAETLPGDQALAPMRAEQLQRMGIDVEIWLGRELP
jgi:hypothetical protein